MSRTDDAAEIFKAWLDGRFFHGGGDEINDDERGMIEDASTSTEPLGHAHRDWLGLPAGTSVGEAARSLLEDRRSLSKRRRLKRVVLDPVIAEAGYKPAVDRLNDLLADEVGDSSIPVSAEWKLLRDALGRPRLWLTITDGMERLPTPFDPDHDRDESECRRRLRKLWGDLLRVRSRRLMDEMRAEATAPGGS